MSPTHDDPHHPPAPEIPPPVDAGSRALEEALSSSFVIVKILMGLLLLVFIFSGVRTVGPQERAVILRFGSPRGTGPEQLLGPGLHWACPYPIDEVVKIPVTEIQRVSSTVGWYSITPSQEAAGTLPMALPKLNPANEGYLVTSDCNIIHARASLGYRITDPLTYTFNFLNASILVQNALNNALIYAAARSTVDEALLRNEVFKERVLARLREQIETLKLGVTIEQGSEIKVVPPLFVRSDFQDVINAEQGQNTTINTAKGQADALVRAAESESNTIVRAAFTESVRRISRVTSDATNFTALLPEYQKNPELMRQRKLVEAWQLILGRAADKFITLQPVQDNQTELWLQLSREPQKARNAETQP